MAVAREPGPPTFLPRTGPTRQLPAASPRRPSEPLVPGPRYRVGHVIGKGGMGEVVAAHDADIGRDVAIKRMREVAPAPHDVARFLREARIQGRLEHPAIVPVHEVAYDESGRPYFAMKKLGGVTLQAILAHPAAHPQFNQRTLLAAFAEVCLAIAFAHTRGVIHRDIKPANILLGEFGEVYILDWGIARVDTDADDLARGSSPDLRSEMSSSLTEAGFVLGTKGYMPPEQQRGERVDGRADVFALGIVLRAIGGAEIAPELYAIYKHATMPRREQRLSSARALGDAVRRYLDGDRDLAQRQSLARAHLAAARMAVAAGSGDTERAVAMREAGRALAFDPACTAAAELIGKLMITAPAELPPVVASELAVIDHDQTRKLGVNTIAVNAGFLVLVGIMALCGVRDAVYLPCLAALSVACLGFGVLEVKTGKFTAPILVCYVVSVALFARMFTPFLMAPVAVLGNLMVLAFHPAATARRFYAVASVGSLVAVLGVWGAELLGLVSQTTFFEHGRLILVTPLAGGSELPLLELIVANLVVMTLGSIRVARELAAQFRAQRDHLHVQAWQLRQLVSHDRS